MCKCVIAILTKHKENTKRNFSVIKHILSLSLYNLISMRQFSFVKYFLVSLEKFIIYKYMFAHSVKPDKDMES